MSMKSIAGALPLNKERGRGGSGLERPHVLWK